MPWVTPRHPRLHKCRTPERERPLLHGPVRLGDVWRCLWCGTEYRVCGSATYRGRKTIYWTRREPV